MESLGTEARGGLLPSLQEGREFAEETGACRRGELAGETGREL